MPEVPECLPRGAVLLRKVLRTTERTSAKQCAPYSSLGKIEGRQRHLQSLWHEALGALRVEDIRGGQTVDLSARGLLSLDAEATQGAKKQLKSAIKLGYSGTLHSSLALRSTERGLTSAMFRMFWPGQSFPIRAATRSSGPWAWAHRKA